MFIWRPSIINGPENALAPGGDGLRFQRVEPGDGSGHYARLSLNAIEDFLNDVNGLLGLGILGEAEGCAHGQNMFRNETRTHLLNFDQTAQHESRADEQDEGKGNLRDDQSGAHAILVASSSSAGTALLQTRR